MSTYADVAVTDFQKRLPEASQSQVCEHTQKLAVDEFGKSDIEVSAEWLDLADRRMGDIAQGKVQPVSWSDIKTKLTG